MDITCYTFPYIPLHHYPWCSGLRPRPCRISCRQNIYFCLIRRLIRQKYYFLIRCWPCFYFPKWVGVAELQLFRQLNHAFSYGIFLFTREICLNNHLLCRIRNLCHFPISYLNEGWASTADEHGGGSQQSLSYCCHLSGKVSNHLIFGIFFRIRSLFPLSSED